MLRGALDSSYQVVFLVDTFPIASVDGDFTSSEQCSNAARLCSLKILNSLRHKTESCSKLRWGYKFFNSRALYTAYERHELKEFSIKNFEEYEKELCKRFVECFEKTNRQPPNDSGTLPCKCLTAALTGLVTDFQWDRLEISSPSRNTRSKTKCNFQTRNLVYIISACPYSAQNIQEYFGKTYTNANALQAAVLSAALHRKLVRHCQISLSWIDSGSWCWQLARQQVLETDWSGWVLVNKVLSQLGGHIIPLSSIVNLGTVATIENVDNISTVKTAEYIPLFVRPSVVHGPLSYLIPVLSLQQQSSEETNSLFPLQGASVDNVSNKAGGLTEGFLCYEGSQIEVYCKLKISPMFNGSRSLTSSAEVRVPQCRHFLMIRGFLTSSSINPSWLHPTKAYTCIGYEVMSDENMKHQNRTPTLSAWFQGLNMLFSQRNCVLVVDFQDPLTGLPSTGVLQPLTSICGILTVINSSLLLAVEKLLHSKQITNIEFDAPSITTEAPVVHPQQPASSCVENNLHMLSYHQIHTSLMEAQEIPSEGEASVGIYSSNTSEPWYINNLSRKTPKALMAFLKSKQVLAEESDEEIATESQLMTELKEYYRIQKESAESVTPGQSKETHSESTMSARKSNRVTPRKKHKVKSKNTKGNKQSADKTSDMDKLLTQDKTSSKKSTVQIEPDKEVQQLIDESEEQKVEPPPQEFTDKPAMLDYVKELYNRAVNESYHIETAAENIITAIWEFTATASSASDQVKVSVQNVLNEEDIFANKLKLKQKYDGEDNNNASLQLRECKLQLFLRAEIATRTTDDQGLETLADESVDMLRIMSFLTDPGVTNSFLKQTVLPRYGVKIPEFLCNLYEGLVQRIPREILTPSKWSSDDESPVKLVEKQQSPQKQETKPSSVGGRPLARHDTLSDANRKWREISVVLPNKGKKTSNKQSRKTKKESSSERKKEIVKTPVKNVKRNLFSEGAEFRAPIRKFDSDHEEKNRGGKKLTRRHSMAAGFTRTVADTPIRKQVANALWQKQHRARKRAQTVTDIMVIKESPLKDIQKTDLPRRSPRKHPGSFYSQNASTKMPRSRSFSFGAIKVSPFKSALSITSPQRNTLSSPGTDTRLNSTLRSSPRLHRQRTGTLLLGRKTKSSLGTPSALTGDKRGNVLPTDYDSVASGGSFIQHENPQCFRDSSTSSLPVESSDAVKRTAYLSPNEKMASLCKRLSVEVKSDRTVDRLASEAFLKSPNRKASFAVSLSAGLGSPLAKSAGLVENHGVTETDYKDKDSNCPGKPREQTDTQDQLIPLETLSHIDIHNKNSTFSPLKSCSVLKHKKRKHTEIESPELFGSPGSDHGSPEQCETKNFTKRRRLSLSLKKKVEDAASVSAQEGIESKQGVCNESGSPIKTFKQKLYETEHICDASAGSSSMFQNNQEPLQRTNNHSIHPSTNVDSGVSDFLKFSPMENKRISAMERISSQVKGVLLNLQSPHKPKRPSAAKALDLMPNASAGSAFDISPEKSASLVQGVLEDLESSPSRIVNMDALEDDNVFLITPARRKSPRSSKTKSEAIKNNSSESSSSSQEFRGTPPHGRTRNKNSSSPKQYIQSSPMNQLLKQRKIRRIAKTNKTPKKIKSKGSSKKRSSKDKAEVNPVRLLPPQNVTDDSMGDWLNDIEKSYSVPSSCLDNNVGHEQVGSPQNVRNSDFTSSENLTFTGLFSGSSGSRDSFQSPEHHLSSKERIKSLSKTPLCASSLKTLEESPIISLSSKQQRIVSPPNSLTRAWGENVQVTSREDCKKRLRLRK